MPRVSVLMGIYNCAKTLEKAIDSIVNQTYTDWELIMYEDGSSDETFAVASAYTERDSRLRLIRGDRNRGLSFALNQCLSAASGEYCARMDGDDLCDNDRFEKQVEFLDTHPEYAFVSTTMKRFDEQGVYSIPAVEEGYCPNELDFVKGSPFCHAPVMIRKTAYCAVDGYRDIEKTRGVEDYDLWFRLYAKNLRGYVIREPLYSMFDGRDASRRRTYKRRINEAYVRKNGYRLIKIPLIYRVYILKPLAVGLIPVKLLTLIKKR